jgi:hypothetical protein
VVQDENADNSGVDESLPSSARSIPDQQNPPASDPIAAGGNESDRSNSSREVPLSDGEPDNDNPPPAPEGGTSDVELDQSAPEPGPERESGQSEPGAVPLSDGEPGSDNPAPAPEGENVEPDQPASESGPAPESDQSEPGPVPADLPIFPPTEHDSHPGLPPAGGDSPPVASDSDAGVIDSGGSDPEPGPAVDDDVDVVVDDFSSSHESTHEANEGDRSGSAPGQAPEASGSPGSDKGGESSSSGGVVDPVVDLAVADPAHEESSSPRTGSGHRSSADSEPEKRDESHKNEAGDPPARDPPEWLLSIPGTGLGDLPIRQVVETTEPSSAPDTGEEEVTDSAENTGYF